MRAFLAILFLFLTLGAQAAKPEPLSYAPWGKRYYVPVPERQLWSQHEVAMFSMTSPADPSRRWLRGVEFKQARVRGAAGDTNGHNYLVVAIKTGARIITPTEFAAKKKGGKGAGGKVSMVTLTWADVPGWTPHWSGLPMMPDGEPRYWGIYSSTNLHDWQFEDRVATNIWTAPNLDAPSKFYVVRWRG